METLIRYLVALNLSRVTAVYVKQCEAIVNKMAQNSKWQGALLTRATAHITELASAQRDTHKGAEQDTATRNDLLGLVRADMRQLKALVQDSADADPANAQTIIESAGMNVVKRVVVHKPPFAVKHAEVPGAAGLAAKKVKGGFVYQWQMSTDGKTWLDLTQTKKTSTLVTGLTPATVYYFRFRVQTAQGFSDWSAVVTHIAL